MMFNEFSHLDFISVVVADPTLPLALARAPALALLQEQATRTETWIGEEEIREEKKRKEEINPEDDENTHRRLQPVLLLTGERRLVVGDGERWHSCGRAPGWASPACVRV